MKTILLILTFLFLFVNPILATDTTEETFFQPINFDLTMTIFFIFITILVILIGVFINGDFASILLLILGLVLLASNLHLIFGLFYIFAGVLFIGLENNSKPLY